MKMNLSECVCIYVNYTIVVLLLTTSIFDYSYFFTTLKIIYSFFSVCGGSTKGEASCGSMMPAFIIYNLFIIYYLSFIHIFYVVFIFYL
jgi:hypothetical protein